MVGESDQDLLATQRGLSYNLAYVDESSVVLTPRVSKEAIQQAEFIASKPNLFPSEVVRAAQQVVESSQPEAQLDFFRSVLMRFGEDPTFRKNLRTAMEDAVPQFGPVTDLIARQERDRHLFHFISRHKNTVYGALAAAATAGVGYYLYKKKQKNDLYNETMDRQPFEEVPAPMSIDQFNSLEKNFVAQNSSRRDPLFTAGVVGNLDRNKVSHYKMGPKKYDHLYGG